VSGLPRTGAACISILTNSVGRCSFVDGAACSGPRGRSAALASRATLSSGLDGAAARRRLRWWQRSCWHQALCRSFLHCFSSPASSASSWYPQESTSVRRAGGPASSDPRTSRARHADRPAPVRRAGSDCSLDSAPVQSAGVRCGAGRSRSLLGLSALPPASAHTEGHVPEVIAADLSSDRRPSRNMPQATRPAVSAQRTRASRRCPGARRAFRR